MITVLGPKLQPLGLTTRIQFPEAVSANTSWSFINALKNDPVIWPYIGLLSYHLYGTNDPYRANIRDFGLARGIPTGQTEYMSLTPAILYDDLTLGGVSVWEVYGLSSQFTYSYNRIRRTASTGPFASFCITSGREPCGSGQPQTTPTSRCWLSQRRPVNTIVLFNGTGDRRAVVNGLPAGDYTASHNNGSGPYQELGVRTVAAGGTAHDRCAFRCRVMTIHSHPGTNQPPVPTTWQPASGYPDSTGSSVTLSATATDPELDPDLLLLDGHRTAARRGCRSWIRPRPRRPMQPA